MDKLGKKFDTITSKNGIKYDLFRLDKDTDVEKFLQGKKFKWNDDVIYSAWNKLGEEVMGIMKSQFPDGKITEKNYQQWVDVVEDVFTEYKCNPNVKDALCNYIDKKPILVPNHKFTEDNDEHQYIKIQHVKSKDNPLLNAKKRLTKKEKHLEMLKKMGITPPPPQAPVEKKPSVLELDLKEFWEKLQSKGKRLDFTYGEMIELVKTYDSLVSKHGSFEDFHTHDKVYSQLLVDTGRAKDTVKHNKKRGKQILDNITEIKNRMEDIEWMHAFLNDKKNAEFYYKTMGLRFKEGKGGKIHYYKDVPDDSDFNKKLVDREWSQRMRADIKILKMALNASDDLIKYNLNLTSNGEDLHKKRPTKFVLPAKKKSPSKQVVLGDGSGAMAVGATSESKPSSDYDPDELLEYGWKKQEHPKYPGKFVYSKKIKIWGHDKKSVLKYLENERAKKKGGRKSRRKRKKKKRTRRKKGGKRKKTKKRKLRKKRKTRR